MTLKPGENILSATAFDEAGGETARVIRVYLKEGTPPSGTATITTTPTAMPTSTITPTTIPATTVSTSATPAKTPSPVPTETELSNPEPSPTAADTSGTVYDHGESEYVEADKLLSEMDEGDQKTISVESFQGVEVQATVVCVAEGVYMVKGPSNRWYDWEEKDKALSQSLINKTSNGYKNLRDAALAKLSGINPELYKQIQAHYDRRQKYEDSLEKTVMKKLWDWTVDKVGGPASKLLNTGLNTIGAATVESQVETCYGKYERLMNGKAEGDHETAMKLLEEHAWAMGNPYGYATTQTDYNKDEKPQELGKILRNTYYANQAASSK